ncbi:MAG TPA: Hsp20/alpha crystallin family protein [Acholeplasmataceae bacterium]|nr:Hsp20/alpha crystallin family protein [Acholeplasmataceae bacterium]
MFNIIRRNRDFFDSFFNDFETRSSNSNLLNTDIIEKDNTYLLKVEMPGFAKEDVKVSLDKGYLTIEAERNYNKEEKDENEKLIRRERFYGTAKRSYYVGDIDLETVKGSYDNGILTLEVPKESTEVSTKKYLSIE